MEIFFLLSAVAVAAGEQTTTTASPVEDNTKAALLGHSLVSSLLLASGFSDVCVATALNTCASASVPPPMPLMGEARELLQEVRQIFSQYENRPRHCKDLLDAGDSGMGPRHVYPYLGQPHRRELVYCDHTLDGGGWTVFQRRVNTTARENFYRTWTEYKLGFGHLEAEFWLGLDLLHEMTSTTLQELRIELADYDGGQRMAKYGFFNVGPSHTNYRLSVGRYSGDAGDSFAVGGQPGSSFSTPDADHDNDKSNCAQRFRGAWWYSMCHWSNLNGFQHQGAHESFADGVNWKTWRGYNYSLRKTSMMIRPAF